MVFTMPCRKRVVTCVYTSTGSVQVFRLSCWNCALSGTEYSADLFPSTKGEWCRYAIHEPVSTKGLHGIGPVHSPNHRGQAMYHLVTGLLNAAIPRLSLASAISRKVPSL